VSAVVRPDSLAEIEKNPMKSTKTLCPSFAALTLCLASITAASQAMGESGRLAIVADGNYRDTDDICATPVSLAILAKTGNRGKLVHYSHSCDLVPGKGDAGVGDGKKREAAMQEGCDGSETLWGPFPNVVKYFNCKTEKAETVRDLTDAIAASSPDDMLTIIEGGEPDVIYDAMLAAPVSNRAHIRIVTHHPNNDRGDEFDLSDIEALPGYVKSNTIRIPDQNAGLKTKLSTWHWARDHQDKRINWLWERGELAQSAEWGYKGIIGDFDCSDAGMVYFWIFGNKTPGVSDLREVLTKNPEESEK
jgi:hypothetical protein